MIDLSRLLKVEWTDLSIWDIGRKIHVQYAHEHRFDVGTLVGIGSDSSSLTIYLQHGASPGVMWDKKYSRVPDPVLYFLPEWAESSRAAETGD